MKKEESWREIVNRALVPIYNEIENIAEEMINAVPDRDNVRKSAQTMIDYLEQIMKAKQ